MTMRSLAPIGGTVGLIKGERPRPKVMTSSSRMEMMAVIPTMVSFYSLHLSALDIADRPRNG